MASTAGNSLSIFSLLDALRRRKIFVIIPTVLLTAGFAVFAHYQHDRYKATAVIAAEQTTPPEYLRYLEPPPLDIRDHLFTVREVLLSDPVIQAAAKATKKYGHTAGDLTPQQIEEFRQELTSQTDFIKIENEHTFTLTYDSGDRYEAMNVANKLAEVFVRDASAKHEQKTNDASKVIDDQLSALTKHIEGESKQIHDYKTTAVHALPDHLDDNIHAVDNAKDQIQDRQTKITDEEAKKASIEDQLKDLEAKGVLDQPMIHEKTPNEVKLDELRIQLAQLQTRYTADHPEVKETKRQISELENAVASAPQKGRSEPSANYLKYSELKADLEGSEQRIAGYKNDIQHLTTQMETYNSRLESTPQHEKVIEDMNRELNLGEKQMYALLDKKLDNSMAKGYEQSQAGIAFAVSEPAPLPGAPYSPQRARLLLMGLAAGLGLGLVLAFVLEQNDTTFGTVDDFQAFTTLPISGVVPNIAPAKKGQKALNPIVTVQDPDSVAAEQYRILAMKVQQQCDASRSKVVMVTSAAGGEGKSLTAINLAAALSASTDEPVLLIDADMRKPRVADYLRLIVGAEKGFHDLLVHADADPGRYVHRIKNLFVIPGGVAQANPVAALSSPKARVLFDKLKSGFAYVIVDAPPVLPIADSHLLAGLVDKVLFVVRARQTPRELFQHALEGFDAANLLGAVLNDVDYQRSRYAYAYEYYKKTA
ncbi:MAG TPA: polysaccharide biosynthesis tyrosine autokinase [Terriglobia bacterium]|jgi:polysaccharide chain length determinant protein (PEP-CTERM system associated)